MIRIIIVDDEILSRIGLQSFLDGKEGIIVSGVFGEAMDAIKFLEENIVDVVLTDIEMAEIDGLKFIQHIREKHLAAGVIIVSCHDDFSYAQQAISLGTDSYILKHNVTEEKLISEIKKVYEKTADIGKQKQRLKTVYQEETDIYRECIYRVGVLQMDFWENMPSGEGSPLDKDMLIHLLEEIVSRYEMGTLFAPYNREVFILFQVEKRISAKERKSTVRHWVSILEKNIRQYIAETLIFGVSEEYEELAETRERFETALASAEQYFYHQDETVFFYKKPVDSGVLEFFSVKNFLEPEWVCAFEKELCSWLDQACRQQIRIAVAKNMLIQNVKQMIHYIFSEYNFCAAFCEKWNSEVMFVTDITAAKSSLELRKKLVRDMEVFHREALRENMENPLGKVLNFIDRHLEEKIALPELADMGCMSVPSFCKKFKEQTGMTVIQYLNEKRIERAAKLLKQQKYSLEEIAELTGFSNTNYLLRVFKKTTGQTIGEYRKSYGIRE